MITIKEVIDKSEKYLSDKGVNLARRQSEEVISLSLRKSRLDLYMHFDQPLKESELQLIRENLARRAKREPIQYIEGKVSFYGCELFVNQDVLIPRNETEILVDKICEKLSKKPLEGASFCDIGTGSGAIAIAVKKRFPELKVCASDLSDKALEVAKKNAFHNQVEIIFKKGDLLEPYENEKFDYIVSNPPYISNLDYESLEEEVKLFEPKMSLVSGKTGLEIYERFAKNIKKYLKKGAKVYFEIGHDQKNKIKEIFDQEGFDKTHFEKDFSSVDRFFFLEIE